VPAGLRPLNRIPISAPPAVRSRRLAAFIAIARARLPLAKRNDLGPSLLAASGGLIVLGLVVNMLSPSLGPKIVGLGLLLLPVGGLVAWLDQSKQPDDKARLLRQLDRSRSLIGLERAMTPGSLEMLEDAAADWERLDHALQTQAWRSQGDLRDQVAEAGHEAMERLVVLECGPVREGAEGRIAALRMALRDLTDRAEAMAAALDSYPRPDFDGNGVALSPWVPEIQGVHEATVRVFELLEAEPE